MTKNSFAAEVTFNRYNHNIKQKQTNKKHVLFRYQRQFFGTKL